MSALAASMVANSEGPDLVGGAAEPLTGAVGGAAGGMRGWLGKRQVQYSGRMQHSKVNTNV